MPNWDVYPEIPTIATSLRQNFPPRSSWDLIDDGGLDGRSGDLLPRLRFARDNNQVVSLNPGGSYEMSDGLDMYDVAETGVVCDPSNPATIYFDGETQGLWVSHGNGGGGCDTGVLEGVEIVFENEGSTDAAVVYGTWGTEFWGRGVTLSSPRDNYFGEREGGSATWMPQINDPSGTAYSQDISLMEGDIIRPEAETHHHTVGVRTDPPHRGTAVFWNVSVSGFGASGFYCGNCPDGRAILVDCYGGDSRGGLFRMGSNDAVIGGTAEQYNGPIELEEGPGHCLSAYYGPPEKFVGVTCKGDLYGNALVLAREDINGTPSTTLDRCVFHVDGNNASPLLRLQDGAEWTLKDCYFYDESAARSSFASQDDISANIHDGTITADSTWHYRAPNNDAIRLQSGGTIDYDGQTWIGPDDVGISTDLGLPDPTPLPDPYIGDGTEGDADDRLTIARNSATQDLESDIEVWLRLV